MDAAEGGPAVMYRAQGAGRRMDSSEGCGAGVEEAEHGTGSDEAEGGAVEEAQCSAAVEEDAVGGAGIGKAECGAAVEDAEGATAVEEDEGGAGTEDAEDGAGIDESVGRRRGLGRSRRGTRPARGNQTPNSWPPPWKRHGEGRRRAEAEGGGQLGKNGE